MRVLLDESIPRDFGPLLTGHEVRTVRQMRWTGTKNGDLLRRAASEGFDGLVTMDQSLEYQQNVGRAGLDVVVLHARSNTIEELAPFAHDASQALSLLNAGKVVHVGSWQRT